MGVCELAGHCHGLFRSGFWTTNRATVPSSLCHWYLQKKKPFQVFHMSSNVDPSFVINCECRLTGSVQEWANCLLQKELTPGHSWSLWRILPERERRTEKVRKRWFYNDTSLLQGKWTFRKRTICQIHTSLCVIVVSVRPGPNTIACWGHT